MATVKSGTVTVAVAGTRVAFPSAAKKCRWLYVRAAEGNTGIVYFGDVTVSATAGLPLHQGTDGVNIAVEAPIHVAGGANLADFFLDAATNNDKASFIAILE